MRALTQNIFPFYVKNSVETDKLNRMYEVSYLHYVKKSACNEISVQPIQFAIKKLL